MAITEINELWRGRTWSDDKTGARSYVRAFHVHTDDPNEDQAQMRVAPGLPSNFEPYPSDGAAIAQSRDAEQADETRLLWTVTVTYEFNPEDPDESEEPEDPTARPADVDWDSGLEIEPIFKDRDDNALVNSAGDYFDPPLEYPIARWQANVEKNVSFVPLALLGWAGAVNSTAYTLDGVTIEARKSRLIGIRISKKKKENDVDFRTVSLVIEFQEDEYLLTPLDQGYRIKDGTDLKDILIEDEDGKKQRPSAPVLLDGNGTKLADPTPENAVFLEFDPPVPEIDFNTLPIT